MRVLCRRGGFSRVRQVVRVQHHSLQNALCCQQRIPFPCQTLSQPCLRCFGPHLRIYVGSAGVNPPGWSHLTFQISPTGKKVGTVHIRSHVLQLRDSFVLHEEAGEGGTQAMAGAVGSSVTWAGTSPGLASPPCKTGNSRVH